MSPLLKTLGATATRSWLEARGLDASGAADWSIEIELGADAPIRFELSLYPVEWGFVFRVGPSMSAIRVTDVPFVHGADHLHLLDRTPSLERLPAFLRELEHDHDCLFQPMQASVRTNLDVARASVAIRAWLAMRA